MKIIRPGVGRSSLASLDYLNLLHKLYFKSCNDKERIEFRDVKDLNTVVLDHSVAPHYPWMMCASSNDSLWYETYTSEDHFEIYRLDCSLSHEISKEELLPFRGGIDDMCCAEQEGISLLVTARYTDGVEAYNTDTKELVWAIKGKMPLTEDDLDVNSITTDEDGRLFVSDSRNACIHLFSFDGKYVTTLLLRELVQGTLQNIWWSKGLSGLIASHIDEDYDFWISVIKIQLQT